MVDKSGMNARSTVGDAAKKAQAFVHELRGSTPDKSVIQFTKLWNLASEAYGVVTMPLQPPTRNEFMYDLGQTFGGTAAFTEIFDGDDDLVKKVEWNILTFGQVDDEPFEVDSASSLNVIHWNNTLPKIPKKPDWQLWMPQNGTIVVPLTNIWVDSGVLHTYTCQVFKEESTGSGKENYVDVYVSSDLGLKVPVIESILTIDVRMGRKTGQKTYTKQETKNAVRTGTQVSRNFMVQKVGRDCLILAPKNYVAPNGLPTWQYLSVQFGYQIVPREGGDTLGPYWPWYHLNGTEYPDVAYTQADAQLKKLIEDTAIDIAKKSQL
jgi:hypothetical protein